MQVIKIFTIFDMYKEFFDKHIKKIKKERIKCEECGAKLRGYHSEVCHILPKSYFKSISKDDDNIIYLCKKHHDMYDNSSSDIIKKMKIFKKISERFSKLEKNIKEPIKYKHYERWQS